MTLAWNSCSYASCWKCCQ